MATNKTNKKKSEKDKVVRKKGHRSNEWERDYLIPTPVSSWSYNYPSYEGKKSDFPSLEGNMSVSESSEATKKALATPWANVVRSNKAVNNLSGKENPADTIEEEDVEKNRNDKVGKMRRRQSGHLANKEVFTVQKKSTDEAEKDEQRTQIEVKESLIQQKRDFLEQIVEVYGKKMAKFITDIEAAEDEKNGKLKEKSAIEMQISDLKDKHERLEQEVKEKDETMINLVREKRDLEAYIENSVLQTKKEIALLEEEMKSLKTHLPPQPLKEAKNSTIVAKGESQQLNLQLIEFISSKILAKEEELECPVCFEVASPPIFACNDLHLICSHCRPKVCNPCNMSTQLVLG